MLLGSAPRLAHRAVLGFTPRSVAQRALGYGIVELVLLGVAVAFIAAFAGTSVLRAIYPFPIDGVEHGALQEVERVRAGLPIYVAPTLGYVPMIYGPLYFYLAAAVASISGSDLYGLRAVSMLSSLGSIALVALLVRRETDSLAMGLVGGALLAACDPLVLGAMDIGRTDATSLFFLLAAIYAGRIASLEPGAGWRSSAVSGCLMGLALLTKQSGAPVAFALLLVMAVHRRRQIPAFVLALGVTAGLGLLFICLQSWPWPVFYLWKLPGQHQILPEEIPHFWDHILAHFTVPVLVGPFYLVGRALAGDRLRLLFYGAVTASMIAMAWVSESTIGGARNVELPAFASLAMLFGLGLHEALRQIGSVSVRTRVFRAYLLAGAIGQFAVVLYNPRLVVPYRSDMWDGQRLNATLAALPGPIFAGSYHGFLAGATDAVSPDLGAVNELLGEQVRPGTPEGDLWSGYFAGELAAKHFKYVIVDPDNSAVIVPLLAEDYHYVDAGPLFPPDDVYWAWRTGWSPKAEVYVPPDSGGR